MKNRLIVRFVVIVALIAVYGSVMAYAHEKHPGKKETDCYRMAWSHGHSAWISRQDAEAALAQAWHGRDDARNYWGQKKRKPFLWVFPLPPKKGFNKGEIRRDR